jgi:hypothetical protein
MTSWLRIPLVGRRPLSLSTSTHLLDEARAAFAKLIDGKYSPLARRVLDKLRHDVHLAELHCLERPSKP